MTTSRMEELAASDQKINRTYSWYVYLSTERALSCRIRHGVVRNGYSILRIIVSLIATPTKIQPTTIAKASLTVN